MSNTSGVFLIAFILLAVWYEIHMWSEECRQTNSWFYCVRMLNK